MIYINPTLIKIPHEWEKQASKLKKELYLKDIDQRTAFINSKREESWGHPDILSSLRKIVGNKCWYSEVDLTGADPNIDHFRPKGKVREIDIDSLKISKNESVGYWWLAFDSGNFRLSSMHTNQRRVDENTDGGKWDFFPIDGERAKEKTKLTLINEAVLPFDPCSATDVALMWFGPDGKPGFKDWRRSPTLHEERRMKVTVWLFHLDKVELATKRSNAMEEIRLALQSADAIYQIWMQKGQNSTDQEKNYFDRALADIKNNVCDEAPFAGAKRCALQMAKSEYLWMEEYF
ncbi:hypothetical protein [Flavobacterium sp. ACN6]|uniref:hypothetical protein n=1 Tax=Flavobacterium sp. ACN6 TaxID=1920426 RepID=UPI000BB3034B|nr:hypothetical protein [Flavobacterium sp. ACN6]PBJ08056.1 hypothetical protein BSF42_37730 [Flavobacterium sp. ACN6]